MHPMSVRKLRLFVYLLATAVPSASFGYQVGHTEDLLQIPGSELSNPGVACQTASKFDPRSASNFDPLWRRALAVALAPSELVGVAETARARVGV